MHRLILLALAGTAMAATPGHAAIFKVGPPADSQCTHATIAAAITAAGANPGPDTIRIALNQNYSNLALAIGSNDDLELVGGFIACSRSTPEPGTRTVIDGADASVLRIVSSGRITLRKLEISGGNAAGSGEGGGIYFQGNGVLDIADSAIINNVAGYGGGIFARGTGDDARLVLGANVGISGNDARYSGGGVYVDEMSMDMIEADSHIAFNVAEGASGSGYGGGLTVRAAQRSVSARIGSNGSGYAGTIFGNAARYGGGAAVVGGDGSQYQSAHLILYSTDADRPGMIRDNRAAVAGGGLFIAAYDDGTGSVESSVGVSNAVIAQNVAPCGAAVYLAGAEAPTVGGGSRAFASFNVSMPTPPPGAVACPSGKPCGGIHDNQVLDANGAGAVIEAEDRGHFYVHHVGPGIDIRGNSGGRLFLMGGEISELTLHNTLVTGNSTTGVLVTVGEYGLTLVNSTIAGNTIGAGHVIDAGFNDLYLQNSIVWQPGKATAFIPPLGPSPTASQLLLSETASLGNPAGAFIAEPRFVDPPHGDFGLRAASPAIDVALASGTFDAHGNPRNRDLGIVADVDGPSDLGAIERQSLLPLVLNADFDFADLRLWTYAAGAWDGTQNISGGPGSGSWSFSTSGQSAPRHVVGEQCIHLPGPGLYRLNGRGKGGGNTITTRDYAVLGWEFRRNGGEACTSGAADANGELGIGSGTAWGSAAQPALIDVAATDWTASSSIVVRLIAVDGGVTVGGPVSAWFDGITLDIAGSDLIFRNGFDP